MKIIYAMVVALVLTGCATQRGFPPNNGIGNFDRLDDKVYRGAQPSHEAIAKLAKAGVTRVINLRLPGDTAPYEKSACRAEGIEYFNVPIGGFSAPTDAQVHRVFSFIETAHGPVYIHCQWGCDRTGTMCACWRIHHDGWSNAQALQEAVIYGLSPWEQSMRYYILHYHEK
jgi:protein tyrosine/serine phosphatase